jgi:hypothetical protein
MSSYKDVWPKQATWSQGSGSGYKSVVNTLRIDLRSEEYD